MSYQTIVTAAAPTKEIFLSAGFPTSRNRLTVGDLPLLYRAVSSAASSKGSVTLVLNKEEESSDFSASAMIEALIPSLKIVHSPTEAKGALVSALLGAEQLDPDLPLLICPGDAFLSKSFETHLPDTAMALDGFTLAFRSQSPRWSFLGLNSEGEISEVAEKRVIGDFATTGHFYFKRASDFIEASKWVLVNNANVNGAFYVSTALNYLVSSGLSLGFKEISRDEYFSFSKPHDFIQQETN